MLQSKQTAFTCFTYGKEVRSEPEFPSGRGVPNVISETINFSTPNFSHFYISMMLFLMANLTISTVLFRFSFCMMWFLCDSTVRTLIKKRSAIS